MLVTTRMRADVCAVALVSRGSLIAAEVIVIVVTWLKMHTYVKMAVNAKLPATLTRVMFVDGAGSFTMLDLILTDRAIRDRILCVRDACHA